MDNWILKAAKSLVKEQTSENISSPTQVKVKVSHLLITGFEGHLFAGDVKAAYPKTIGRAAVGVVTEVGENCYGVEKGQRVYFKPTRACGKCLACLSGKPQHCSNVRVAGRDFDGFLRDFVVCDYNDVSTLPDSVDDLHALCIETVGIAETIYDKLNLSPGQRVAVVGCDFSGILTAQVLQYHKVIPIIIDNNPSYLEKAKKCGVYFTFFADDDLDRNVLDATGGDLCDAAIYSTGSRLPLSLAPRLLANGKHMVLTGYSSLNSDIAAADLLEKNITLSGVTYAYDYTDTVINMMLHQAVNIDVFEKEILKEFDPVALISERASSTAKNCKLTVLKMIF